MAEALAFTIASLALLIGAAGASRRLALIGRLDRAIALAVLAAGEAVVCLLVAGALLRDLHRGEVLAMAAGFAVLGLALGGSPIAARRPALPALVVGARRLRATARGEPFASVLVGLALVEAVWMLVVAYALPPRGYDGLWYHLTTVAGWMQAGHIGGNALVLPSATYPANGELMFAWVAVLLGSDTWIDAVQIGFALLGALAVAGIARTAGVGATWAAAAGALFFLAPIVLVQSTTDYVDVIFASCFLVAVHFVLEAVRGPPVGAASGERTAAPAALLLGGVAGGLALGTKSVGLLACGVLVLVLAANVAVARRRRRIRWSRAAVLLALFVIPIVGLGGFWYVRDWVEHGSPTYPVRVRVAGLHIGGGPLALSQIETSPPKALEGKPAPLQVVRSWGHDLVPHRSYRDDQRLGGLGMVWLYLGVPLLVLFAVGELRRRSALFWSFLVPLGLVFVLSPYPWWSRFSIALLAPAMVAVVTVPERWRSRRARQAVRAATVPLVLVPLVFTTGKVSWESKTILGTEVLRLTGRPAAERTVGRVLLPQFRWVDSLRAGARIGVFLARPQCWHCGNEPFFYPLYGRRFDHRVFPIDARSARVLDAWVARHAIQYIFVRGSTTYDRWAQAHPGAYRLLYRGQGFAAYRTA